MANWLERTCSRRCLVQSVVFGTAAGLLGLSTLLAFSASADTLSGPHRVESSVVEAAKRRSELPHEFVDVEASGAIDTGIAWVETKGGRETRRTPYWAVPFGEKFLLVKSDSAPSGRVVGVVEVLGQDIWSRLGSEDAAATLPFLLDARDPRPIVWIGDLLLTALTACATWLFVRSFRRSQDPTLHPAIARLGNRDARIAVSAKAESELASEETERIDGRAFTPSYLVEERWSRFDLRAWRDLVWAYPRVTKHSVNFIPTGKTFDAVLCFSDGAQVNVAGSRSEQKVRRALELAERRAPWAVHGFDERVARAWKSDRAGLAGSVAARRDADGTAAGPGGGG